MNKKYIIVAGINGAGKTTFYRFNHKELKNKRLNADEIQKEFNGDWKNNKDNFKAMRILNNRLYDYLKGNETFHHETTLSGLAEGHLNRIDQALKNGFTVELHYFVLDSYKTAQERVSNRVSKGGHGIDNEIIKKRYYKSIDNFNKISPKIPNVFIYDNSGSQIKTIYEKINNKVLSNNNNYDFLKPNIDKTKQDKTKNIIKKNNDIER